MQFDPTYTVLLYLYGLFITLQQIISLIKMLMIVTRLLI